jgi:hypothetical protein
MHGGLSPELESIEQIKKIEKPTDVPDTGKKMLIKVYYVIYFGQTQIKILKDGEKMKEEFLLLLGQIMYKSSVKNTT